MSGGEQQRVAIARALALHPKVLLFDEPTSALDPESTREVLQVMRELADDGMTMLIVTHEVPFARRISDRVVFLDGGHIIEQGTAAEVLDRPTQSGPRRSSRRSAMRHERCWAPSGVWTPGRACAASSEDGR